jgi:hypothetical protein
MSRKWLLFLFCLGLLVVFGPLSRAALSLHVNESAIKVLFEEQSTRVVLPIENSLGRQVDANIKIEIVNTDNATVATAERSAKLNLAWNEVTLPVSRWLKEQAHDTNKLLWYRLRYSITPANANDFTQITNVISLSEITPEIFTVDLATAKYAQPGAAFRLRVKTAHPQTTKPVPGINIEAQIKFEGSDRPDTVLKQAARTDGNGFATIDFQIPANVEGDDGEIEITARHGALSETVKGDIDIDRSAQVLVSLDKPLYQPGQTLHARVLMFDASRHAIADGKATLKISDPESTTTFRTDLTASRFGVASIDWPIPENTRLGDYRVEVRMEGENYNDAYGAAVAKISRYDLPNFTVNVKPDRPFYLPGQNADVEVRADYLFGQPVKRGHVRVVRETDRQWNYREQKWDTEEGDTYEGDVDADGRFTAQVKLDEEHEKLQDEDYTRFQDLTYAAYFTDPTTNRTEQRRFDLRVTKDVIHIYIVNRGRQARNFPLEFYVSTSYADGTPASCDVAVSRAWDDDEARPEIALRTFKTDRNGLAKITGLMLPKLGVDDEDPSLMFRARDNRGGTGTHSESFGLDKEHIFRIATEKSLYRDGEPIRAEIASNQSDVTVALDAIGADRVIQSQLVHIQNGRASVTVPYRKEFSGAIALAAYDLTATEDKSAAMRTVLYPHDHDLKLNLRLNHEMYRPGEEATADFLTRAAAGYAKESALGVVIFDKAVEERARSDRDFGGNYGFYRAYCYLSGCDSQVAGITRNDLDRVDLTKPLPDGLDLVAEVLLTNYGFAPQFFHSKEGIARPDTAFKDFFSAQIDPLKDFLELEYKRNADYPKDESSYRRLAVNDGIAFDELRDPWDMPYRNHFFPEGASDVLEMISAGPDKTFDTADDFPVLRVERPYFRFTGEAINRAVQRYHNRTGRFIRDAATMKTELRAEAIDFDALRDPWGELYRFEFGADRTKLQVLVSSSGPDKQFSKKDSDDVPLWTSSIDYTADLRVLVDAALASYLKTNQQLPQNDGQLDEAFKQVGINRSDLRDPWGRPYYATFQQTAVYGNRVTTYTLARYGEKPKEKTEMTPVTRQMNSIMLRSNGADGVNGTYDDFNVASFSRLLSEQAGDESKPQQVKPPLILPGSSGAIVGTVTDPNGAVVVGARVTAKSVRNELEYATETDDYGKYLIKNLPVGVYQVTVDASGFKRAMFVDVVVRSSSITRVDVAIEVGAVSEAVTVTGSAEMQTMNSMTASTVVVTRQVVSLSPGVQAVQTSTPRLREYFPETLVWQPSLETDKQGRAQLKFKLADNITTWKMSVIGSTEDGQIGTTEKEFTAFQPFFVEHDPPRVLTEGDEISLPVVVRNYLNRDQNVNLEIKPENWFTLLNAAKQDIKVTAGDSSRGTFDFRATAAIKDGKQRITAIAGDANDAIEKPVTVHPDGEEKSVTGSDIVSENGSATLDIPALAIANSEHGELKIYPNLLAHVAESVEAIMSRPYGCGEQTISSTYPSLLLLRNVKYAGQDSALRGLAQKYLRAGYSRLLNYRHENGGFTYWGRGEPDLALTAYALRFLSQASDVITVDDDVINQARVWLTKQQRVDGSWVVYEYDGKTENKARTLMLTAYLARVLAMTAVKSDANDPKSKTSMTPELRRALDYLSTRIEQIDEPYAIASYAIARIDAGDSPGAVKAIMRLRGLAKEENGGSYWALETNTPFYGWGLAGRIETTALVVQALSRYGRPDPLINRGLVFLLRAKDRYGVWHSTQATINVLDALVELFGHEINATSGSRTATIVVNGREVKSIELPEPQRLANVITVDLSQFMQSGSNQIQLRRPPGSTPLSMQAVATYYIPWRESVATQEANWRANGSSGLRLVTKFDKTEGRVSDAITCHVEAERIGFRGYGMMLAEIGLPPGADVDRASIETAMKGSDWSISQYDILPDRVVVYLWPRAGGTKFDFKFRPRFGLKAQTASSIVYDYYNPEARAIVAPAKFVVK